MYCTNLFQNVSDLNLRLEWAIAPIAGAGENKGRLWQEAAWKPGAFAAHRCRAGLFKAGCKR